MNASVKSSLGSRLLSDRSAGVDHTLVTLLLDVCVVRHVVLWLDHATVVLRLVLQRESLVSLSVALFTIVLVLVFSIVFTAIVATSIRPVFILQVKFVVLLFFLLVFFSLE
jgi:hypothetical protein